MFGTSNIGFFDACEMGIAMSCITNNQEKTDYLRSERYANIMKKDPKYQEYRTTTLAGLNSAEQIAQYAKIAGVALLVLGLLGMTIGSTGGAILSFLVVIPLGGAALVSGLEISTIIKNGRRMVEHANRYLLYKSDKISQDMALISSHLKSNTVLLGDFFVDKWLAEIRS